MREAWMTREFFRASRPGGSDLSGTMPVTDAKLYGERIAALVARFSGVPPLWARYPRVHPLDIHWRMGGGEDYKCLFNVWVTAQRWNEDDRIAYLRRWDPPYSWLEWAAWFLWPEDFVDVESEVSAERWSQLDALGFGSQRDWRRCFDVDPDEYPCADDVSTGWLKDGAGMI